MFKQSEECDALMRRWHAANLALWNWTEHLRSWCPADNQPVATDQDGFPVENCTFCGAGNLRSVDRLKRMQENERQHRLAFQRKQREEIERWQREMQMPMFTEETATWE